MLLIAQGVFFVSTIFPVKTTLSLSIPITFGTQFSTVERGRRLQEITESKWMDAIGVLLVLVISFALGFHKTVRQDLPIGIFNLWRSWFHDGHPSSNKKK